MNPHDALLAHVAAVVGPVPEARLRTDFVPFACARGQVLMPQGEACRKLFFLNEGSLRHVVADQQGRESTCDFSLDNQFVTDIEAFTTRQPAHYSLVALEACTGLVIGCEPLMALIETEPALEKYFRTVLEEGFVRLARFTRFRQLPPAERFAWLMAHEPALFQRLPQQYLAGYIGIRPESLSRLKRRYRAGGVS